MKLSNEKLETARVRKKHGDAHRKCNNKCRFTNKCLSGNMVLY